MKRQSVRAITTRYKGYSFRSRLEARWAVFFDHLGIKWEYEPEGFELGNGLRYLPDFWLPDWQLWVEVKPGPADAVATEKASRLAELGRDLVLIAHGMPGSPCTLFVPRNEDAGGVSEHECWVPWHEDKVGYIQEPAPDIYGVAIEFYPMKQLDSALYSTAETALQAARAARFEFGANGGAA